MTWPKKNHLPNSIPGAPGIHKPPHLPTPGEKKPAVNRWEKMTAYLEKPKVPGMTAVKTDEEEPT